MDIVLSVIHQGKKHFGIREYLRNKGIPDGIIYEAEFNQAIEHKRSHVNRACEMELSFLTANYPATEIATFDKQEAEANAYTADNAADTPLIDAMATARGIDKGELVSRILAKAAAFSVASGAIIGKRHKLEDLLNAMTPETHSINDIQAITWDNAE